jgi:probable phosphoglycerate mutase
MTILLLVRHASNDYLKEGRLAGRTPGVHINALGQKEADELARRIAHLPIEAIYSSPLERALDTAHAVAYCQKLPVQVVDELIETEAGEWTGRKIDELRDTDTWKAIQTSPVGVKLPGGESIDEVQTRMVAAVERIHAAHPEGVVAVVSHADPLKSLIAHYLKWDLNHFQGIAISPASVSVLGLSDKGAVLLRLNDTGPLPKFERAKPPPTPGSTPEKESVPLARPGEGAAPPGAEAAPDAKEQGKMAEANIIHDLNPVSRVTVGAVGEPGQRVFYLQGSQDLTLVTLVAEKEQVLSLGQGISDLLTRLGDRADAPTDTGAYDLELRTPFEPLFRIGQLGLGYDQENNLLVIVAYALTGEEEPETVDVVRFWATRDQMRALARHVTEVAAAGRPVCVLCGRPIDPEGHFCPRRNGHGARAQIA